MRNLFHSRVNINRNNASVNYVLVCEPYKGVFTLRLESAGLVTETGKFQLPIGQLRQLTNSQSELLSHKSRPFKCQT